jgi:hypothetical protein
MVVVLITSGGMLFSLGIVAEYLGITVKTAMGKPLYLVVNDPSEGPLGRAPIARAHGDDGMSKEPTASGRPTPQVP